MTGFDLSKWTDARKLTPEQMAEWLGISRATYYRELADSPTSFHTLLTLLWARRSRDAWPHQR